jgi:hypothetical protein
MQVPAACSLRSEPQESEHVHSCLPAWPAAWPAPSSQATTCCGSTRPGRLACHPLATPAVRASASCVCSARQALPSEYMAARTHMRHTPCDSRWLCGCMSWCTWSHVMVHLVACRAWQCSVGSRGTRSGSCMLPHARVAADMAPPDAPGQLQCGHCLVGGVLCRCRLTPAASSTKSVLVASD